MLLEVVSAAISVLGGREKVHLGHVIPHRERAGMFSLQDISSGIFSQKLANFSEVCTASGR
jgi:hypothetical protein